jgi:Rrf2 family iron-sulfur cluster assembly transcriptional regulator
MLDLAIHAESGPITLAEVASRQHISLSYLEQLFARLRRHSLVSSVRGPGGGYMLGRDAHEISVADVITAVDESVDTTRCNGAHDCQENRPCLTHDLWEDLSARIYEYLGGISLRDLIEKCCKQKTSAGEDVMAEILPDDSASDQIVGSQTGS